jgi:hypothetical protein
VRWLNDWRWGCAVKVLSGPNQGEIIKNDIKKTFRVGGHRPDLFRECHDRSNGGTPQDAIEQ